MSARWPTLVVLLLSAGGPALAQSFSFDSDEPIEITADSLEVVQANRIATFAGNVDAVQGDLVLSADKLLVHYRGSGDAPQAPGSSGAIRRIEAHGSVVVTSPRETAEGDVGVYDVPAALVTLEGSVVLTRDENVVRGDRLELDLSTGISRVVAATTAEEGAAPDRRVRAVFVPNNDEAAKRGKAEQGKPPKQGASEGATEGDGTPKAEFSAEGKSAEKAPKDPAESPAKRPPVPKVKPGDGVEDGG